MCFFCLENWKIPTQIDYLNGEVMVAIAQTVRKNTFYTDIVDSVLR